MIYPVGDNYRVVPKPNCNQKPEPLELCFQEPKGKLEPSEPFFRNRNRAPLADSVEAQRSLSPEEPSEPKNGTIRTVLCVNHNRTGDTL